MSEVRGQPGSITSDVEEEEIPGSASGALLCGAVALAFQTLALLENLADRTQRGWSCGQTDREAEPEAEWAETKASQDP